MIGYLSIYFLIFRVEGEISKYYFFDDTCSIFYINVLSLDSPKVYKWNFFGCDLCFTCLFSSILDIFAFLYFANYLYDFSIMSVWIVFFDECVFCLFVFTCSLTGCFSGVINVY